MQDISKYAATNDKLRLLLQGPPGSGKTTLACQFPGAYFIDVDVNLGGPLRWLAKNNLPLPVGFDVLDKDSDGKEVPLSARYLRLEKLLIEAQSNPAIETIVLDSTLGLIDVAIAEILRQQMKSEMSKREWGFFAILGKKLFSTLASMRKHIVLITHERQLTDTNGNAIYPIKVNWPGQVGDMLGGFFTNVWRCEVEIKSTGPNSTYKWVIRTMPDYRFALKNTLGLPATFEFSWQTIQTALQ